MALEEGGEWRQRRRRGGGEGALPSGGGGVPPFSCSLLEAQAGCVGRGAGGAGGGGGHMTGRAASQGGRGSGAPSLRSPTNAVGAGSGRAAQHSRLDGGAMGGVRRWLLALLLVWLALSPGSGGGWLASLARPVPVPVRAALRQQLACKEARQGKARQGQPGGRQERGRLGSARPARERSGTPGRAGEGEAGDRPGPLRPQRHGGGTASLCHHASCASEGGRACCCNCWKAGGRRHADPPPRLWGSETPLPVPPALTSPPPPPTAMLACSGANSSPGCLWLRTEPFGRLLRLLLLQICSSVGLAGVLDPSGPTSSPDLLGSVIASQFDLAWRPGSLSFSNCCLAWQHFNRSPHCCASMPGSVLWTC